MYLITSDPHFGHENILLHERSSMFDSIELHDDTITSLWEKWLKRLRKPTDTFYFLGDLCFSDSLGRTIDRLEPIMRSSACRKVMVRGNHDKDIPSSALLRLFDEVHDYPIFISNRVVLSHYPQAVYRSQVNIHGHTHGMDLCDANHLCASIHVARYCAVEEKDVSSALSKVGKWNTRYLYEPWAQDYRLTQKHRDAIADADGRIDLSASRISHMLQNSLINIPAPK